MWIWWISLIIFIASSIFVYRMFVSSYDFLPGDKPFSRGFIKNISPSSNLQLQETIKTLRNKIQSLEDNTAYYEIQFSKFQQKLKLLEEGNTQPHQQVNTPTSEDEEDWKEMYFEENEIKEKLENELDETRQKLEESEIKLKGLEENQSLRTSLQSDYDARLNDLQSMKDHIGFLQKQILAAAEREKELEQLLAVEISHKNKYSHLESDHLRLLSETENLRHLVVEMNQKEKDLELRIKRLNELESKLAIFDEEKQQ